MPEPEQPPGAWLPTFPAPAASPAWAAQLEAPPAHGDIAALTIDLDAAEPWLDHHRPGGLPLLGTAMGIELMMRAAMPVLGAPAVQAAVVVDVSVRDPLILQAQCAQVHVTMARAGAALLRCGVQHLAEGRAPLRLFEANIGLAPGARRSSERSPAFNERAEWSASASDVYALFFHGPAFQVVRRARYRSGGVLCELNTALPPLTRAGGDEMAATPRWIELCMQAAGLLEVAENARMMIPHRIDRIEWFVPEAAATGPLFAWARKRGPGDAGLVDVDLLDAHRQPVLHLRGYRTVPLPFAADGAAVNRLHRCLSES